jgi:hypothetical protein
VLDLLRGSGHCPAMPWSRKLKPPLDLKDGRRLETLDDARRLLLTLPARHKESTYWRYAAALLMEAANDQTVALHEVEAQLARALKAEGLL